MDQGSSPQAEHVIIRSQQRFALTWEGISSRHVFSAGPHYDPTRLNFGPLIAVDEHTLDPGAGFGAHRHRDVEILTWVLAGTLTHEDDAGHSGLIRPGQVQYQRAGIGVTHAEVNASNSEPCVFVQIHLRPPPPPGELAYSLIDTHQERVIAAPKNAPITLLTQARLAVRRSGQFHQESPADSSIFCYVLQGSVLLSGEQLQSGDSLVCGASIEGTVSGDGLALMITL